MMPSMPPRHVARPPSCAHDAPDPRAASGRPLRWGVVSTGMIARRVAQQLAGLEDALIHAVSSRNVERARAFAQEFGAETTHADAGDRPGHVALAADPDVDVAYVAAPHGQHHAIARALLEAGKHVLLEKAFTITAAEAADLVALARQRGRFLMEAVWTRFLPVFHAAVDVVASGELGEVRWVQADLGFHAPRDTDSRLWAPESGGGALLDLGVYGVSWARAGLGDPLSVTAHGVVNDTGVDGLTALTLRHRNGGLAQITATLTTEATRTATLAGTEGTLRTWAPLTSPTGFTVARGHSAREVAFEPAAPPYTYMLREVTRCVQQGLRESPTMPLGESVAVMGLFDDARRQIGVRYPNDDRPAAASAMPGASP
jgi:predicted dehydrogenase